MKRSTAQDEPRGREGRGGLIYTDGAALQSRTHESERGKEGEEAQNSRGSTKVGHGLRMPSLALAREL